MSGRADVFDERTGMRRTDRRTWKKAGDGGSFFRRRKKFGRVEVRIPNSPWWGFPSREGDAKKAIGSVIPLQRILALQPPSRDSVRRNLQGVPEGIVPPAFVGARDASREVTRYSMPTDQFGGKRSNLSRLENPIDI